MSSDIEQAAVEDQATVRNLALMVVGFGVLTAVLIVVALMVT
ncbi:MAG: hypothetical protein VW443_10420 [Pseudomonadales bacterium]|jgi:hypothetical protein